MLSATKVPSIEVNLPFELRCVRMYGGPAFLALTLHASVYKHVTPDDLVCHYPTQLPEQETLQL